MVPDTGAWRSFSLMAAFPPGHVLTIKLADLVVSGLTMHGAATPGAGTHRQGDPSPTLLELTWQERRPPTNK